MLMFLHLLLPIWTLFVHLLPHTLHLLLSVIFILACHTLACSLYAKWILYNSYHQVRIEIIAASHAAPRRSRWIVRGWATEEEGVLSVHLAADESKSEFAIEGWETGVGGVEARDGKGDIWSWQICRQGLRCIDGEKMWIKVPPSAYSKILILRFVKTENRRDL
jgi:uncharacterized membrane protein YbaN (DUF454 family)